MTPLWAQPLDTDAPQRMFNALSPEQKKVYGSVDFFIAATKEARDLVHLMGGDPVQIVDRMEQSVRMVYPFRRYYAGAWPFRVLSALPDVVSDKLWSMRHIALGSAPRVPPGLKDL